MGKHLIAALVVGALVIGSGAAVANGGQLAAPLVSLQDAITFRADFGFDTDPTTVKRLLGASDTDYTYGGPLSLPELANLHARLALRSSATELVEYVNDRPSDFGGLYFDQTRGRLELTILVTPSTPAAALAAANGLIPPGLGARTVSVANSYAELLSAQDALTGQMASLGIAELWPDVKANRLSLVVRPGSDGDAVRRAVNLPLTIEFGTDLTSVTCGTKTNCTPYRGGIYVGGGLSCTWGYYATRGSAAKYMVTAGHCWKTGASNKFTHNGVVFTDGTDRDTFDLTGTTFNSDSLTAHVLGSPNAVAPFNTFHATSIDKSHAITGTTGYGSQAVGDMSCFSGVSTGTDVCGTIEAKNLTATQGRMPIDNKTITLINQTRMSRGTLAGDSGAPVYNGTSRSTGIVVAADVAHSGHMVYSAIDKVASDMQVTFCITSAC
jgi:hypothetical protein